MLKKATLHLTITIAAKNFVTTLFLAPCRRPLEENRDYSFSRFLAKVTKKTKMSNGSQTTPNWLLYILTDSALPTGGFVASSGLESAAQHGFLKANNSSTLDAFIRSSTSSFAHSTIPFVRAAWEASSDGNLETLSRLDAACEATIGINAVAKRASLAQGTTVMTLWKKCFETEQDRESIVKKWKDVIQSQEQKGHFAICWGVIGYGLKMDLYNTMHLWLYLYTRTLLSSAVRLNLVGPYQAQRILLGLREETERILEKTRNLAVDETCQTNPVLDLCQGIHDRLYSRLFNS